MVRLRRDPFADPEPLIRRVYAYAAYRLGAGPDAEDVTSEVFVRALQYESSFDPRKGDVRAWLIGIARRCVDERLAQPGSVPFVDDDAPGDDDLEERTLDRLTLEQEIGRLGERDRELVSLYYAGLNGGQIAHLLGRRRNVVDVALHRALGRLRLRLENKLEPAVQHSKATVRRTADSG